MPAWDASVETAGKRDLAVGLAVLVALADELRKKRRRRPAGAKRAAQSGRGARRRGGRFIRACGGGHDRRGVLRLVGQCRIGKRRGNRDRGEARGNEIGNGRGEHGSRHRKRGGISSDL